MNRATRSEQGSLCRLERLLCAAFALNQPSPRTASSGLSLALALMHALFPRTPGPAPAAQAKAKDYQPLAPPVTAVPPATSTRKSALCPEEPRTLVLRTIVPRSPHVSRPFRELHTIVASSNLLNVWDMLESCKSVGHGFRISSNLLVESSRSSAESSISSTPHLSSPMHAHHDSCICQIPKEKKALQEHLNPYNSRPPHYCQDRVPCAIIYDADP